MGSPPTPSRSTIRGTLGGGQTHPHPPDRTHVAQTSPQVYGSVLTQSAGPQLLNHVPSVAHPHFILHAPPISAGDKRFTEDWALIELHGEKINWEGFKGNVIHLGTKITSADFVFKMHPHIESRTSFKYPRGGLSTDVTYASPYHWIECIKKALPNSYLYPITA